MDDHVEAWMRAESREARAGAWEALVQHTARADGMHHLEPVSLGRRSFADFFRAIFDSVARGSPVGGPYAQGLRMVAAAVSARGVPVYDALLRAGRVERLSEAQGACVCAVSQCNLSGTRSIVGLRIVGASRAAEVVHVHCRFENRLWAIFTISHAVETVAMEVATWMHRQSWYGQADRLPSHETMWAHLRRSSLMERSFQKLGHALRLVAEDLPGMPLKHDDDGALVACEQFSKGGLTDRIGRT